MKKNKKILGSEDILEAVKSLGFDELYDELFSYMTGNTNTKGQD